MNESFCVVFCNPFYFLVGFSFFLDGFSCFQFGFIRMVLHLLLSHVARVLVCPPHHLTFWIQGSKRKRIFKKKIHWNLFRWLKKFSSCTKRLRRCRGKFWRWRRGSKRVLTVEEERSNQWATWKGIMRKY